LTVAPPVAAKRPPSREGKRVLSIYLAPEAWKQLRLLSLNLGQRNAVKAMFTSPRRHHQFSLCNECIDEMHRTSNEFIAKGSPSMQPSLAYQQTPLAEALNERGA
jgi:hypothetical protein